MALYNFEYIDDAMQDIIDSNQKPTSSMLNELKKQLNRAFPDCECLQVLYTDNQDKLFFGMCCYPDLTDAQVKTIIQEDEPVRITKYILEIDSKLFDPILNLSAKELTAIVMHEVGHMTNTSNPADEVRNAIDMYLTKNDDVLKLTDSANYTYILKYAIQDTLLKLTSVFYQKDEEYKADGFAIKNGYGPHLESAMEKIYRKGYVVNRDVNDKFIVMSWCLRLYKNVKLRRIPALRTINRAKSLSPSKVEIRALDNLANRLKRIDDMSLIESAVGKKLFSMKMKGISGFENDLYEYRMMVTNIEEQDEAIMLMRQINSRLSILEDMLENKNGNEAQVKKINKLIDGFKELREDLAKKVTYKDRFIGVVVNYPAIKGLDY